MKFLFNEKLYNPEILPSLGNPPYDAQNYRLFQEGGSWDTIPPMIQDNTIVPLPNTLEIIEEDKPKLLDLNNIMNYIIETRGGDIDLWSGAADSIAYHESSAGQRMDPKAVQVSGNEETGFYDGPGRGMFQFEPSSLKTAQTRYKNIADVTDFNIDQNILDVTDARDLSKKQQYTLFFANLIESDAVLKDFVDGKLSLEDLWLQGHKNKETEGNRESFRASIEDAKNKGIKNGYSDFTLEELLSEEEGGELPKAQWGKSLAKLFSKKPSLKPMSTKRVQGELYPETGRIGKAEWDQYINPVWRKDADVRTWPTVGNYEYRDMAEEFVWLNEANQVSDNVITPYNPIFDNSGNLVSYEMENLRDYMSLADYKRKFDLRDFKHETWWMNLNIDISRLHNKGLIHGDLHSGNIMVKPSILNPKEIVDFKIIDPAGVPQITSDLDFENAPFLKGTSFMNSKLYNHLDKDEQVKFIKKKLSKKEREKMKNVGPILPNKEGKFVVNIDRGLMKEGGELPKAQFGKLLERGLKRYKDWKPNIPFYNYTPFSGVKGDKIWNPYFQKWEKSQKISAIDETKRQFFKEVEDTKNINIHLKGEKQRINEPTSKDQFSALFDMSNKKNWSNPSAFDEIELLQNIKGSMLPAFDTYLEAINAGKIYDRSMIELYKSLPLGQRIAPGFFPLTKSVHFDRLDNSWSYVNDLANSAGPYNMNTYEWDPRMQIRKDFDSKYLNYLDRKMENILRNMKPPEPGADFDIDLKNAMKEFNTPLPTGPQPQFQPFVNPQYYTDLEKYYIGKHGTGEGSDRLWLNAHNFKSGLEAMAYEMWLKSNRRNPLGLNIDKSTGKLDKFPSDNYGRYKLGNNLEWTDRLYSPRNQITPSMMPHTPLRSTFINTRNLPWNLNEEGGELEKAQVGIESAGNEGFFNEEDFNTIKMILH